MIGFGRPCTRDKDLPLGDWIKLEQLHCAKNCESATKEIWGFYAPFVCTKQSYVGKSGLIGSQKRWLLFLSAWRFARPPTTPAADDAVKLGTLLHAAVQTLPLAFLKQDIYKPPFLISASSDRLTMAAPSEQRIAVPIDDPNADTEWQAAPRSWLMRNTLTPP